MRDYVIAVGGTGARCLEAIVFLAAAGLLQRDLHVLVLDPDQNNGNGRRTRQLLDQYSALQHCTQPTAPRTRNFLRFLRKSLDAPTLFQARLNEAVSTTHPYHWRNPNAPTRTFEQAINLSNQPSNFQSFIRLYYQDSDLAMPLNKGYQGRTSVGAVTLKIDLDSTIGDQGGGLREFVEGLQADLQNGDPKVFVAGSVFGGTGAAALPTIRAFLQDVDPAVIGPNAGRIQFGCAMLIPYFSFPKGNQAATSGPMPDSDDHMIATKAALLHYSHVPPGYRHVYLLGAPERYRTATTFEPGDEPQLNRSHYAELVAGLAARDFFKTPENFDTIEELHFGNDVVVNEGVTLSLGIDWHTLPMSADGHREFKRRLVSLTTFAYFYKNFLHRNLIESSAYAAAPWYRDNFRAPLTLNTQRESLNRLLQFSESYLEWLHAIGASGTVEMRQLFRWEGLLHNDVLLCSQYLGHLTEAETGAPLFLGDAYHQILKRMDQVVLENLTTQDPVGLFIYLLYHAVDQFCVENYKWRYRRTA